MQTKLKFCKSLCQKGPKGMYSCLMRRCSRPALFRRMSKGCPRSCACFPYALTLFRSERSRLAISTFASGNSALHNHHLDIQSEQSLAAAGEVHGSVVILLSWLNGAKREELAGSFPCSLNVHQTPQSVMCC